VVFAHVLVSKYVDHGRTLASKLFTLLRASPWSA
jgi:hypothetical protein